MGGHEVGGVTAVVSELTAEQAQALDIARQLVAAGVPLFVAAPCPADCNRRDHEPGRGHNGTGFHLPPGWQTSRPTPDVVNRWRPGWALCAVMGHALDLVDVDPRNGGDATADELRHGGMWPRSYGRALTPSGGWHDFIAPLGVHSRDNVAAGLDVKSGAADGGHGFAFIAPTVKRSKVTGEPAAYRWERAPDLDALAEGGDDTGIALADMVSAKRAPKADTPSSGGDLFSPPGHIETRPAGWHEVMAHILRLAGELAAAPDGAGNDTATRLAFMAGQYVGAGQVTEQDAVDALTTALRGWTWRDRGHESAMHETIRRQVAKGAGSPRPWGAAIRQATTAIPIVAPQASSAPVVEHDDRDDFWQARPALATVRRVARERLVSPWAALAGVLAHVCSRIGPHVVLPPIVGGVASLNSFWAFVGASGGGKDAAMAVGRELLWLADAVPTHEVGTGQGIDATYTMQTKDGPVQFCDAALFTISEIDTLAAHAKMSGATIMATLRKVYSGSALGARYADKEKRRPVRDHRYRAAVIAGVQPARSAVLLGDADGGTPQRWLWMPTDDPGAEAWANRPAPAFQAPSMPPGLWQQYQNLAATGELSDKEIGDGLEVARRDRIEIKVCAAAIEAVIASRRARLAAGLLAAAGDLQGHTLLTRLKVGALLAVFDGGRAEVSDEDWQLASVIIDVSDTTRQVCAQALADTSRRANAAKAHDEIDRAEIVEDRAVKRAASAIVRTLTRRDGVAGHAEVRRALPSSYRAHFGPAVERLEAAGQVAAEASDRGTRLRLAAR